MDNSFIEKINKILEINETLPLENNEVLILDIIEFLKTENENLHICFNVKNDYTNLVKRNINFQQTMMNMRNFVNSI